MIQKLSDSSSPWKSLKKLLRKLFSWTLCPKLKSWKNTLRCPMWRWRKNTISLITEFTLRRFSPLFESFSTCAILLSFWVGFLFFLELFSKILSEWKQCGWCSLLSSVSFGQTHLSYLTISHYCHWNTPSVTIMDISSKKTLSKSLRKRRLLHNSK